MNHKFHSHLRSGMIVLLTGACLLFPAAVPASAQAQNSPVAVAPVIGGCSMFPENNVWNTPVDDLPVDTRSTSWINSIGRYTGFHMDFGTEWENAPIGIPYNVVDSSVTKVDVTFEYDEESDPGPYPIPDSPLIEGGNDSDGDRHILIVDSSTCKLYELYAAYYSGGHWTAGSGAIWNLNSNELRTAGWTSADAAGLPILPGLVRYEEVLSGEIDHAIRFTASRTAGYIWPARHLTSEEQSGVPPMGARFRLKSSYDISGFDPQLQVILQAMKTYGIILADNGSNWYISGAPNSDWDDDLLHDLDVLRGDNFEVVDTSELMDDPDSGATTQTFVVTATGDDGAGSLRQAVADAASDDRIVFDPSLAGQTITLTNNLDLTKDLTIDGSGLSPQVIISGEHIAHMVVPSDITVTISDVTIINGNYGVSSRGNLTVRNSTLKNNVADMGGAISSYAGSLTIENSTITQNHANYSGGALDVTGGTARIVNSTIAGNEANHMGGGIWLNGGAVEIINSTFARNSASQGSEIFINTVYPGTVAVTNSIFACAETSTSCYNYPVGSVTSNHSILGNGTLASFGLDALADNGGPTQTMALLMGSPAINTGDNADCPAVDQRGVTRPKGTQCDMGAYEYDDTTPPTVLSSLRLDTNPTSAASVRFTLTFSEPVTGVDAGDFALTATGTTGAAVTGVSGSNAIYTVTVNPGMVGAVNGTLRLNVVDDDSIQDAFSNRLGGTGAGNGNFNAGEAYSLAAHVARPTYLSPPVNYITNNPLPVFTWGSVTDASRYEIQFASDSGFTVEVDSQFVNGATFTPEAPLADGKYYWHVRAFNILDEPGGWSALRSFTVDRTGPAAPTLRSPANDASLRTVPTFRWNAVSDAVLYQFQLDNNADFSSPLVSVEQRTTSRKPAGGLRGTYSWRVRARDAAGNWSEWSPVFTIHILRAR